MARKTAVITGCSSGIGYALAVEFAKHDIQVFATARNEESLRELEQLHANITALPLDVCSSKSIQCLHDKVETLAPGGELAYLVNNAGAHYAAPGIEMDRERVRMLFETNVFGVMQLCSTLADMLIAGRGTIVQIGSVTRNVPVIWQSAYNASKAALSQYSSTLRLVSGVNYWLSSGGELLTVWCRSWNLSESRSAKWLQAMCRAIS
jgi:1-acylglycerone phosphate reductase